MSLSERYLRWVHDGGIAGFMCAGAAVIWSVIFVGLGGGWIGWIPISAAIAYPLGAAIGGFVVRGSGRVALEVLQPTAPGTYAHGHSAIQALEAQERFLEAADAWEGVAAVQPENPWPLIRAGELYRTHLRQPERARDRFLAARDLPSTGAELRLYAMQKLIDLYLGPLGDEGRALVELRRLVEEYPATTDADAARRAIASIKAARAATDRPE